MEIDAIRAAAMPLLAALPVAAWLPHELIRKPDGKLDKPPCAGARSNDPKTWFTIDKALDLLAAQNNVAGIGFAITAGIIGLDYDDCRNPVTGELSAEVQQELERFNSYAYVTPSKTGIRIVGKNDPARPIPGGKRVRYLPGGHKVEIFVGPTNFYNTFTSDLIDGYTVLRDIYDDTLDYLEGLQGHTNDQTPPSSRVNGSGITPNINPARSIEAIRAALAVIPNDHRDWDEWCRIGMATWRSSDGSQDGYDAWVAWSAKSPCHNPAECAARWQHWFRSPPTYAGFATLYHSARRANPLFVAPYDPATEEARQDTRQETPHDPETGEVKGEQKTLTATPFWANELGTIRRRQWVYGHFIIKRFLAVLGAPGGTGKTAYALAIGASVALNRPLVDEPVHESGPVWIYNLEDPREEILRRLAALIQHHNINPEDLEGKFYMDSGRDRPLIVAEAQRDGTVIALPVVQELIAEIKRRGVKLLIVDPFVKSHRLEENRNEQIDFAASLWSMVADQADCAILLLHHFRKGGLSGDAAAFRGASALIDAARSAVSLATMSEEEAEKLGVDQADRRFMVRADNAKLNLAPPPDETIWIRLQSVELNNGDPLKGIKGDNVQAVERWVPPSVWDGLSMSMCVRILDKLNDGLPDGEQYTVSKRGADNKRWAGSVVVDIGCKTDGQAAQIIRRWIDEGVVEPNRYMSPTRRKELGGLSVDLIKLSEMRQRLRTEDDH